MSLESSILDALTVGVVVLDEGGRIMEWNEWMAETSGRTATDVVQRRLDDVFPEIADSALAMAVDNALSLQLSSMLSHHLHPRPLPLDARRHDGGPKRIEQSIIVRPIEANGRRLCLIQVSDVSAAAKREMQLREIASYSRMLFEVGLDPLNTIDRNGRISDVNPAFENLVGRTRRELVGSLFADCFTDPETAKKAFIGAMEYGAQTDVPLCLRHIDGHTTDVIYNFTVFHSPDGSVGGVFVGGRDITERLKAARELEILATTDSLTGLANRRHFLDLVERELERARRYQRELTLFILDLDHFKRINDTHGHGAGDEVLRRVADACRETVRSSDVVGRIGGEELAILLPETGLEGGEMLGERLCVAIAALDINVRGAHIHVTTSIGIASLWPDETLEDFLTRCDNALYEAKHKGRNRVVIDWRTLPKK